MRWISSSRVPWAIVGVLVLAGTIWGALASGPRPAPAVGTAAALTSVSSRQLPALRSDNQLGLPTPIWCCSGGNPIGLTVTGEATVRGTGKAARATAVAQAVADALDQGRAAASAAGITLGRIINMQVSAYYPYPVPMMGATAGRAGSTAPGGPPSQAAQPGTAPAIVCPAAGPCPPYPYAATATVTVTWAIG